MYGRCHGPMMSPGRRADVRNDIGHTGFEILKPTAGDLDGRRHAFDRGPGLQMWDIALEGCAKPERDLGFRARMYIAEKGQVVTVLDDHALGETPPVHVLHHVGLAGALS